MCMLINYLICEIQGYWAAYAAKKVSTALMVLGNHKAHLRGPVWSLKTHELMLTNPQYEFDKL